MRKLSLSEIRKIQLEAQGLRSEMPFGLGKEGVVQALKRLGYVQIDTISVVERAHHHIFWSRVPDYKREWLHELQTIDKKVLEYWSHAAAFLPIEDYRYCLPRMYRYRAGEKHWWERDDKTIKSVYARIKKEGPLLARDFENTLGRRAGPWFDRTPAKKALEYLFHEGRLLISERRGFQKIYEIAERYLPDTIDVKRPTNAEYSRYLIDSAIRPNGIASLKEITYLRKVDTDLIKAELKSLIKQKLIEEVQIPNSTVQYFSQRSLEVPKNSESGLVHVLSPFDNLVIQRQRLKNFFGFDYQIECYVPEAKRKYGYFVLPLLRNDEFFGRADLKADRATKKLFVKSLHFESNVQLHDELSEALAAALKKFATFNSCQEISFETKVRLDVRKKIKKHL